MGTMAPGSRLTVALAKIVTKVARYSMNVTTFIVARCRLILHLVSHAHPVRYESIFIYLLPIHHFYAKKEMCGGSHTYQKRTMHAFSCVALGLRRALRQVSSAILS